MIQEIHTSMPAARVLEAAKEFFAQRGAIYAVFLEQEGEDYLTFRGQGGEEIVIGVTEVKGGTRVRGSTYLFDQQVGRFLASLDPAPFTEEVVG
jgi:hypothetical protein